MASLNYDIGPDVLNRIKGAYRPINKNIGKGLDNVSDTFKEFSDEKGKELLEEKRKARLEEARADAKKVVDPSKDPYEKTDISGVDATDQEEIDTDDAGFGYDWESSFSEPSMPSRPSDSAFEKHKPGHGEGPDDGPRPERPFGYGFEQAADRGSVASSNLFDQFQTIVKDLKDSKFINGDKKDRAIAAKDMGELSASLQMYISSINDAKDIYDGVGFSKALRPDEMFILDKIASQEDTMASVDENNNLIFNVPLPDGSMIPINRNQFDTIVEKRIRPAALEKEFLESLSMFEKMGKEGKGWNNDVMIKQNMNNITPENIDKFVLDPIFGSTPMAEDYQSSPKLKGLEGVDINKILEVAEKDEAIYNELKEDVAEYVTMMQKQAYDRGTGGANKSNTEGLTASQKLSYYRNLVK